MASVRNILRFLFPALRPGDGWRTAVALALAALAVQGVFLWETAEHLFFCYPVVDSATYYYQALGILQGQGTVGAFWQPPGYPHLLALFCAVGNGSLLVARCVQALLLAPLTALLAWRIARRLLSPAWAAAAALATTLTGPLLFYQSQLLPAAPAATLVCAGLLLALRAVEQPSAGRWFVAGVVNGVVVLFAATAAAFVPVFAWFAWFADPGRAGPPNPPQPRANRFRRAGRAAILIFGVLLVLLPVAMRNYAACGKWVWISCNGGTNFYVGNNRTWDVTLSVQPGFDWDKLMRLPYLQKDVKDAVDADRWFGRTARAEAKRDRTGFAERMVQKAVVFWHGREIPRNLDIYGWRETSRLLAATVWRAGVSFPTGVLVPLALAGAVALHRRREARLLAGSAVAFGLLVAFYFPCSRYRVPVLPVVAVFALAGVQALTAAAKGRDWRRMAVRSAMALAAAVAVNLPFNWPTDSIRYDAHLWNAIGVAADVRGDQVAAKSCYEEAVRRDPKLADAHFNLGTIYARRKDRGRAETCYEAAIAARADYDKARVNLAIHLADRGEVNTALRQLSMAESLNPLNAEAFANHAAILQRAGRNEEALEKLAQAGELDSRYRAICRKLQQALQQQALQKFQPKPK